MQKMITISVPLPYTTATALMYQALKDDTTVDDIMMSLAIQYVHDNGLENGVQTQAEVIQLVPPKHDQD